jgi:hypothetical protein
MQLRLLLAVLALAAGLGAADAARADLMATCAADIQRFCPSIDRGQGRISACLAAFSASVSTACRTEVARVSRGPLVPRDVRTVMKGGFSAAVPAACTDSVARFCQGVPPGDGRVFACLYANSNRVPKACTEAARATIRGN